MYFELRENEYTHGFPVTAKAFKNIKFEAHWHNELEFLLMLEGSMIVGINSEFRLLKKDDVIICPSGSIHSYHSNKSDSLCLIVVFKPELLENTGRYISEVNYKTYFIDEKTRESTRMSPELLAKVKNCFVNILEEMNRKEYCYEVLTIGYLLELIGILNRILPYEVANGTPKSASKRSSALIQKAIKYISNNYTDNIRLADVSEHLGVSTYYFSRIFNGLTGLTFKEYINKLRVEKAYNLIKHTQDPIINIAFECGFNSLRTFNRVFKELLGITPSSLRSV